MEDEGEGSVRDAGPDEPPLPVAGVADDAAPAPGVGRQGDEAVRPGGPLRFHRGIGGPGERQLPALLPDLGADDRPAVGVGHRDRDRDPAGEGEGAEVDRFPLGDANGRDREGAEARGADREVGGGVDHPGVEAGEDETAIPPGRGLEARRVRFRQAAQIE